MLPVLPPAPVTRTVLLLKSDIATTEIRLKLLPFLRGKNGNAKEVENSGSIVVPIFNLLTKQYLWVEAEHDAVKGTRVMAATLYWDEFLPIRRSTENEFAITAKILLATMISKLTDRYIVTVNMLAYHEVWTLISYPFYLSPYLVLSCLWASKPKNKIKTTSSVY